MVGFGAVVLTRFEAMVPRGGTVRVVLGVVVGSESESNSKSESNSVSRSDAEEIEQTQTKRMSIRKGLDVATKRQSDKRELTFAFLVCGFFLSDCLDNGFAQLVDRRFSWVIRALEPRQGSVNHLLELDSRIKNPIIR